MNPTPEQVAQWAREAGMPVSDVFGPMFGARPSGDLLQSFATLACAWQAEQDAKVCSQVGARETAFEAIDCAAAIRANAPKGAS